MQEKTFRINIRNIQDHIENDFLGILKMYKNHMAFLLMCGLRNKDKYPEILFEEDEMHNMFIHQINLTYSVDVMTAVTGYIQTLDGFARDVFNDLTYYIDEIISTTLSDVLINIVSITINRFYELEFTVKQLIKRTPKSEV